MRVITALRKSHRDGRIASLQGSLQNRRLSIFPKDPPFLDYQNSAIWSCVQGSL